eukprot:TRINITY_DN8264_c0_g1_i9.p1 TRINITY_DN8264_c0_g1~~TRINITY_DN8264_c0_g1_i9.p1  ORF type:complete len:318 (+),score=63.41 TRINITY_DN8264_c0_g1_i9:64-1017(+)
MCIRDRSTWGLLFSLFGKEIPKQISLKHLQRQFMSEVVKVAPSYELSRYNDTLRYLLVLKGKKEERKNTLEQVKKITGGKFDELNTLLDRYTKLDKVISDYERKKNEGNFDKQRLEEESKLLKEYNKDCNEKVQKINDHNKILLQFATKYREKEKEFEQKRKEIEKLQFILSARRKRMLFQLCFIFFNSKAITLFRGAITLSGQYGEITSKKEEVNMTLGYLALLLNLLSKYLNIPLIYPTAFYGSRSLIMEDHQRALFLYVDESTEKMKFDRVSRRILVNLKQILNALKIKIDTEGRDIKMEKFIQSIIQYLYQKS